VKKFLFWILVLGFAVDGGHAQTTPGKTVHHAAAPPVATAPTLQEAIIFLEKTLSGVCPGKGSTCTATLGQGSFLIYEVHYKNDDGSDGSAEYRLDMKELDPSMRIMNSYVHAQTIGQRKLVQYRSNGGPVSFYDYEDFCVSCSPQDLQKTRVTLVYMVQLVQGTTSEEATRDFLDAIGSPEPVGPKMKETTDFLNSKLKDTIFSQGVARFGDGSSAPMRQSMEQTDFLGGCQVVWNVHIKRQQEDNRTHHWDDGQDSYIAQGVASAKDFIITSSQVESWSVKEQWDPAIFQVSMPLQDHKTFLVFAGDQELANRIQRALIGLGKLCGAKDEPY
jgi:hypothetical protein